MCEIQRRKISPSSPAVAVPAPMTLTAIPTAKPIVSPSNSGDEQVISSSPSPTRPPAELLNENERLRKENLQLSKQLSEMRSLCNNIFNLISNYANNGTEAVKPLELMPEKSISSKSPPYPPPSAAAADEVNPMLFGVAIGAKRAREYEEDTALRLHRVGPTEIKSEPFNFHRDNQETPWLNHHHQLHSANQRVCN